MVTIGVWRWSYFGTDYGDKTAGGNLCCLRAVQTERNTSIHFIYLRRL